MEKNIFNSHAVLVIGDFDPTALIQDFNIAVGDQMILTGEEIKIIDLRELVRWLNLKPLSGGLKLVIIKNIDKIPAEASNTLLKTLEEPPAYAKIILTTLDEQKILPTIHSRCQKIRLLTNPQKEISAEYLSPDKINQLNIKQRFEWVAKTAELSTDQITDILTAWQLYYRQNLLTGKDETTILKEISRAKDLLQTNISVKLLLENLMLKM